MPSRTVSEDVFRRIVVAIQVIEQDPDLKRTKREIERLSGLSHDVVARAFRLDRQTKTPWEITERFDALSAKVAGGNSATQQAMKDLEDKLRDERKRSRELEETIDIYATALYALYMNYRDEPERANRSNQDPVPIGRNRQRER